MEATAFAAKAGTEQEDSMGPRRAGRILLVEDEAVLRGLVAQFLRGEGHDVVEAADGLQGADRFRDQGPFDLVLLDLNLPFLPGVEVCRRVKQLQPRQPIIVCSAAILDDHLGALESLGVQQFLTKPYHPAELLCRVALELDRAAPCHDRGDGPQATSSRPATQRGGWRADQPHARQVRSHTLFKEPSID
jgi:DNA-binding response OmpR family regulator